jgi:lipopolysaccharide export system protein LptA
MKKTRWALLTLLALAITVVVAGYYVNQKRNVLLAPAKPVPLPQELLSLANDWTWSHSSGDRPQVEARAKDFRQIKDSNHFELAEVELKIFSKSGDSYDLVRSHRAEFNQESESLHSEGEVTIVLGLPAQGPPEPGKRYVEIHTSGLTYNNRTGISSTDRAARFQFPDGEGASIGAEYDSVNRRLWLKSQADLRGAPRPMHGGARMHLRAGELYYHEAEQKVELRPWSSVKRGPQGVEGTYSTVYLEKGELRRVETLQGEGFDVRGGREVRFAGDRLEVDFGPGQSITKATGLGNARLVSGSASGRNTITGGRFDLEFTTPAGASESELAVAHVRERARLESVPVRMPGRPAPDKRVLSAEWLKVTMRPGGEDLQKLETLGPGRLEFVPSEPNGWKRTLEAGRLWAEYSPGNRLEKLYAADRVHLRSEPPQNARLEPRLTWSDNLEAWFDPPTGQLRELHQWSKFRYQEGGRQAAAHDARFDVANDRTRLETGARVWDGSGSTTADVMLLDQKLDHFTAEGRVTSTYQEAAGIVPQAPGALFSPQRPVHAAAQRMESRQGNQLIEYRGSARLWQEGDSVQAEEIQVDRGGRQLAAKGRVTQILTEEQHGQPRVMTIHSEALRYTDEHRRAFYSGKVRMLRDRMTVQAEELEAFLRPSGSAATDQSRLERAKARGQVQIRETAGPETAPRSAFSEVAEYFAGEEKVVLRGGRPRVEQPGRASTTGAELTYYLDDDRLLVSGRPGERAETHQKLKPR